MVLKERSMGELREIAEAYLKFASKDIQEEAWKFFKAIDYNSDGSVNLHEFLDFMRQEQYHHLRSSGLFKELCESNSENLGFMDVMTLYYIIKSGRPFCDGCDQFIKEIYFCCSQCFHSSNRNYCLCLKCFKDENYNKSDQSHHHQFVDNFTLLELKRIDGLKSASASNQVSSLRIEPYDQENDGETLEPVPPKKEKRRKREKVRHAFEKFKILPAAGSSSTAPVPAVSFSTAVVPAVSSSTAVVPATEDKRKKMEIALKALERALVAASGISQIISCAVM